MTANQGEEYCEDGTGYAKMPTVEVLERLRTVRWDGKWDSSDGSGLNSDGGEGLCGVDVEGMGKSDGVDIFTVKPTPT